ncbi:MAG: phosphate ABC transporter substrate-binding protein PstS [Betaproteobacteria bacterium]|nr:phosphate ABC transporter substrate-binding protein PstS [Betaproteobacteria bacterium]
MKNIFNFAAIGAAAALLCGSIASAQEITGAGASFPAPVYSKWAADYNKATGVKVNYQSVGSGAGIKQIDSKTVDFGASDMPLTDEVLKSKGQIQFPTVIGGTVPVVNIKGIAPGQMKLDGQVLGDIFLGKITKWDDAAIKALNPGLALPDAAIAPVRRADGSGTTFNFTNYLSRVHPEWKAKVGEGTAVNWPVGAGGKGNEGVAAFVSRLPNSIGYVEYSYVKQNKMTYAQMKNHDGVFVSPNEDSFKAAAAGADWNKSFYQLIVDQPGKNAWPISTATFILMHIIASDLDYVPMPDAVIGSIEKAWGQVTDASGKPVAIR